MLRPDRGAMRLWPRRRLPPGRCRCLPKCRMRALTGWCSARVNLHWNMPICGSRRRSRQCRCLRAVCCCWGHWLALLPCGGARRSEPPFSAPNPNHNKTGPASGLVSFVPVTTTNVREPGRNDALQKQSAAPNQALKTSMVITGNNYRTHDNPRLQNKP